MNKGITLIEVVIVVALILTFTGMGITSFVSYQETMEASGVAGELLNDLKYAKQMSITRQVRHGLEFDFSEDSYKLIKYGEEEEVLNERKLEDNLEIESPDHFTDIKFNHFGAVFGSREIIFRGEDFIKTINVRPSGFIDVERDNIN